VKYEIFFNKIILSLRFKLVEFSSIYILPDRHALVFLLVLSAYETKSPSNSVSNSS
jgi:hypothetical protein